ncbi:MAG: aspartate carbamoyltransferase catalytic subunit [Limnochordia bacterium]|jgi:aspartate carbamoyltransferase catalytic subunit
MAWKHKDLLGLQSLTKEELQLLLDTAEPCKEILQRPIKKVPTLRGKVMVNLFYEPSTRTRTSFELAGKWLSAEVVNLAVATSSVQKGESFTDTAKTIEALGANFVVIRHNVAGSAHLLAKTVSARVINAGDGFHEHPTQGLLDLFTIREHKGQIEGLQVAIVGDIRHSRVARSNIWGLTKLGAQVTVVGPATLIPPEIEALGVQVSHDLDQVLPHMDVIILLRIQRERQTAGLFPSFKEYAELYGMNSQRLERARADALIMHPGPANLGVEITNDVAEDPRAVITEQVTNGVAVRMAVLYLLSGGETDEFIN